MKLHVATRSGDGVGLAFHSDQSGMTVTLHAEGHGNVGNRIDAVLPKYRPDAVVLDGLGYGAIAAECEAEGIPVLFGGKWAELMSADMMFYDAMLDSWGFSRTRNTPAVGVTQVSGCWYNNGVTGPYFTGTVYTRLMAGNIGPSVPPVMAVLRPSAKDAVVDGLDAHMRGSGYRGLVTVSFNAEHEPCGLTVGLQPAVLEAVSELTVGGIEALISGRPCVAGGDCGVAVRVSTWPWPAPAVNRAAATTFDVPRAALNHFWPHDVLLDDGVTTVPDGASVGMVSARGRDVGEAMRRIARTLRAFTYDGFQYRTDAR